MAIEIEKNPLKDAALFQDTIEKKLKKTKPSAQENLPDGMSRVTYILPIDHIDFVKSYAYTKRIIIREAIEEIVSSGIENVKKQLDKDGIELLDPRKRK